MTSNREEKQTFTFTSTFFDKLEPVKSYHLSVTEDFSDHQNSRRLVFCHSSTCFIANVLHHSLNVLSSSVSCFFFVTSGHTWQLSERDFLWQVGWTGGLSVCMWVIERDTDLLMAGGLLAFSLQAVWVRIWWTKGDIRNKKTEWEGDGIVSFEWEAKSWGRSEWRRKWTIGEVKTEW